MPFPRALPRLQQQQPSRVSDARQQQSGSTDFQPRTPDAECQRQQGHNPRSEWVAAKVTQH